MLMTTVAIWHTKVEGRSPHRPKRSISKMLRKSTDTEHMRHHAQKGITKYAPLWRHSCRNLEDTEFIIHNWKRRTISLNSFNAADSYRAAAAPAADRPAVRLEAITTEANPVGTIYNPSGVGIEMTAAYKVFNDYPHLVPNDTIHWAKNNNNINFYGNQYSGDEAHVIGINEGSFKLTVTIDDFPSSYAPYIYGRVVTPITNKIKAYLICNTNGVPAVMESKVNEWIVEANRIYRQIAVNFELESIERVYRPEWSYVRKITEFANILSNEYDSNFINAYFIEGSYMGAHGVRITS